MVAKNSFLPSVLPAWTAAPGHADAAGNIAGRLKAVWAEAKVWPRRNRVPPAIIPNCKFLVQLFGNNVTSGLLRS